VYIFLTRFREFCGEPRLWTVKALGNCPACPILNPVLNRGVIITAWCGGTEQYARTIWSGERVELELNFAQSVRRSCCDWSAKLSTVSRSFQSRALCNDDVILRAPPSVRRRRRVGMAAGDTLVATFDILFGRLGAQSASLALFVSFCSNVALSPPSQQQQHNNNNNNNNRRKSRRTPSDSNFLLTPKISA